MHPDFGSYLGYGIPYNVVSGKSTPKVQVSFEYADESDASAIRCPSIRSRRASGDGHVLLVDKDACRLYELFDASGSGDSWKAGSGAVWNLRSNHLRPNGWTSRRRRRPADPARPRALRRGRRRAIRHALRFTAERTARAHIYPARHDAGSSGESLPPMGLRVRLKASVDISGYGKQARVVLPRRSRPTG